MNHVWTLAPVDPAEPVVVRLLRDYIDELASHAEHWPEKTLTCAEEQEDPEKSLTFRKGAVWVP
ncbi:hypothetical protein [Saccharopolyspora phatthalungensis]|uniref:Uncharacterized protein n=1 Tax=Saccharopolyspora phatthalungensis TaxID=664693 RepID=A0A840Q9Z6_9PSEU|nr:hypothetical protein [Saccharopolyspora phatthalungensis]MBB5156767.1 hypothetical protein [Saccharopolyspora phatthalungensis]